MRVKAGRGLPAVLPGPALPTNAAPTESPDCDEEARRAEVAVLGDQRRPLRQSRGGEQAIGRVAGELERKLRGRDGDLGGHGKQREPGKGDRLADPDGRVPVELEALVRDEHSNLPATDRRYTDFIGSLYGLQGLGGSPRWLR